MAGVTFVDTVAKTATRRAPARRPSTPAKRRKPAQASLATRVRRVVGEHLGKQADDVWGVLLVVAGLLAALGIHADLTGPVGRGVRALTAATLGLGRFVVPATLLGMGAMLLRGRPRKEPGRVAIGVVCGVVAVAGLLHLMRGDGLSADELRRAGGILGAAVAEPLRSLLAIWGASLVLVTLLGLAILILTKTSVSAAADIAFGGAVAAWQWIRRAPAATRITRGEELEAARRHPSVASTLPVEEEPPEAVVVIAPEPEPEVEEEEAPEIPTRLVAAEPVTGEQLAIGLGPAATRPAWRLPPLQLLKKGSAQEVDRRLIESEGRALEEALAAHGVATRVIGHTVGPTVTRYELELDPGVKVARVTSLHKDIAYAMAAADVIIRAPIPGKKAIGIEVPNKRRSLVAVGDILGSEEAHKATHPLEIALGRDIAGRPVMVNLAEMPHILIAGATGAGKSSCINTLVTSVLVRSTPDQVRLILVDPKRVELGQYNELPHLLTQVVVNPKKAANALAWAVTEMERRYDLLAEVGVRDITGYNGAYDRGELQPALGTETTYERLPFILIVVDELNDLMMVAARDVEESICRIAQMARAVGIHLVIATQRPSVDVITGVIKANIPSRLAFAVSSLADSRVILDQPGAERLIGQGDMLLLTASSSVARRIQGAWVGEDEVRKVVAHWRRQAQPDYLPGVEGDHRPGGNTGGADSDDDDDMLEAAMEIVVRSQLGSTSMLQRKLRVGFARAGRIMDLLEQRGVVGPSEGSKARAVLMTAEEFDARQQARTG